MSDWIPVTQQLPEKFLTVVLCNDLLHSSGLGYYDPQYKVFMLWSCGFPVIVTHWLPLPEEGK